MTATIRRRTPGLARKCWPRAWRRDFLAGTKDMITPFALPIKELFSIQDPRVREKSLSADRAGEL